LRDNAQARSTFISETLGSGDIERCQLEWRSLLNHIACAPDLPWERWQDFRDLARVYVASFFQVTHLPEVPELTAAQQRPWDPRKQPMKATR
jgi:hypothetical protein